MKSSSSFLLYHKNPPFLCKKIMHFKCLSLLRSSGNCDNTQFANPAKRQFAQLGHFKTNKILDFEQTWQLGKLEWVKIILSIEEIRPRSRNSPFKSLHFLKNLKFGPQNCRNTRFAKPAKIMFCQNVYLKPTKFLICINF